MKTSQKIKRLEAAFRENFNANSVVSISPNWQTGLLERLHQFEPFNILPEKTAAKFENKIWRLIWITFATSIAAAIIFAVYIHFQPNDFEQDSNNAIYSDLAMLD